MVIDVEWIDYDGDEDLDFIFCGDWMFIIIFRNEGGGELDFLLEEENFLMFLGFWNIFEFVDLN